MNSKRIYIIDDLRGLFLILMLVQHFCYTMDYIAGFNTGLYRSAFVSTLGEISRIGFLFVCGVCCIYSSNNRKRGYKICACAMLVTAATFSFDTNSLVIFGVLHCIGASMLIISLIPRKAILKLKFMPSIIIGIALLVIFIFIRNIGSGYVGLFDLKLYLPKALYTSNIGYCFGFAKTGIYSADYFGLLPWFVLILSGLFFGNALYQRTPKVLYHKICPPLEYIGRKTLLIYLVHQPVFIAMLYAIKYVLR